MTEKQHIAFVSKSSATNYEANRIKTLKFLHFDKKNLQCGFYQVKAQFSIANITHNQIKFNYLLAQLELKFINNICDIIQSN